MTVVTVNVLMCCIFQKRGKGNKIAFNDSELCIFVCLKVTIALNIR